MHAHTVFPVIDFLQSEVMLELGTIGFVLECDVTGDPVPEVQWLRLPEMTIIPSSQFSNYVCIC